MTNPAITAVVRCGDLIGEVYRTVDSVLSGPLAARTVSLIAERGTPVAADAWLESFAQTRGVRFLRVDGAGPGAAWNAGLDAAGASDFALCVEAGDALQPQALAIMAARLASDRDVAVVTSGIEWVGPGTRRSFSAPAGGSAVDLLADPLAAHTSSLFRWSMWKANAGFDEEMPALEHTDFWLRLIAAGNTLAVEPAPLLARRVSARALHRRTWLTPDYRRAVETLFARHWQAAALTPGALLQRKETAARAEHLRHEKHRASSPRPSRKSRV